MIYALLSPLGRFLSKLLFRLKATGRESIPRKGGLLIVSNHASYLDPVILDGAVGRPVYFFARSELFEIPLFGWLIRQLHAFPVHLGRLDKDAIKRAIKELKRGRVVVVYPEGTRSRDGTLQRGQAGAGFFAVKAGVPVLPVYLRGTYEALTPGSKKVRLRKISIHFGSPLFFKPPEALSGRAAPSEDEVGSGRQGRGRQFNSLCI